MAPFGTRDRSGQEQPARVQRPERPSTPPRIQSGTFVITIEEITLAIVLLAGLDPAGYKHPRARALIEKCKAEKQGPHAKLLVIDS